MPPALETAAARGPPEVRAMPARSMGYLMPSRSHSWVWRGGGGDMVKVEEYWLREAATLMLSTVVE